MRRSCSLSASCPSHFNPRIPYGMRRSTRIRRRTAPTISIHASRMGCDRAGASEGCAGMISIHASRMGCDGFAGRLSTNPSDFNPRIPYGMRLLARFQRQRFGQISIHASRMGCDIRHLECRNRARTFQSTHPVWDATGHKIVPVRSLVISIHASRMGCDIRSMVGSASVR